MAYVDKIIPILIVALSFLWAYPLLRLISAWLVDRTIDGRVVLLCLAVHITVIATMWSTQRYLFLLIYLAATTVFWLLSPLLNKVGESFSMLRMRDEDMARFQRLVAMDPRNASAHAALGDLYVERRRLEDAAACYRQAIAISPEHSRAEQWKLQQVEAMMERRRGRQHQPASVREPEPAVATLVIPEPPPAEESVEAPAEAPPAPAVEPVTVGNWYDENA